MCSDGFMVGLVIFKFACKVELLSTSFTGETFVQVHVHMSGEGAW